MKKSRFHGSGHVFSFSWIFSYPQSVNKIFFLINLLYANFISIIKQYINKNQNIPLNLNFVLMKRIAFIVLWAVLGLNMPAIAEVKIPDNLLNQFKSTRLAHRIDRQRKALRTWKLQEFLS